MFARFNSLPVRQEYLDAVLSILRDGKELSSKQVAFKSRLTLTQAGCALDALIEDGRLEVRRQKKSPKVTVKLS